MAIKKYADGEGKLEVLRGHEAQVLADFEAKVGKTFTEFDDDARKELHKLLDEAHKLNEKEAKAAEPVKEEKPEAPAA